MYPGMDYRMNLWIYLSRYGLQDRSMDLCIQVWITGWIYELNVSRYGLQDEPIDHMYPGMDYRMNLWIYVSRYGLQDESMNLCIQVWITG